jgi:hypothetical protein
MTEALTAAEALFACDKHSSDTTCWTDWSKKGIELQ